MEDAQAMTQPPPESPHPEQMRATKPIPKPYKRLQPISRSLNPLDYRIHIGWFGGVRIYSKSQSHEHRQTGHSQRR